jgi:predicted dithiol-disulfide oxidoreductase (DUF899 family)
MALPHHPRVVSREHWLEARQRLLQREKDFNRERDALTAARKALPWVKIDKSYVFDGDSGKSELGDLFDTHSQLIVYHFMYGTHWSSPCPSCSFWADNFNGTIIHLNHRDVNLVAVAHAPYPKLAALKRRMGWCFDFYSSYDTDFNYDFDVSFNEQPTEGERVTYNYRQQPHSMDELPGVSVFYKDAEGHVYHTYSTYSRGLDMLNGAYHYLDITPKGRDEDELPYSMSWLRLHDSYNGG